MGRQAESGWRGGVFVRCLIAGALFAAVIALNLGLLASPLQAAGLGVTFSSNSIVANGLTHTVVTADTGNPLELGDTVTFSPSDSAVSIGPTTDNLDGTYSATITSSTTAETVTINASDSTAGTSGSGAYSQVAGPATSVTTPQLGSGSIASGHSTTASVDVTDANNNPVSTDTVSFSQSGSGHVTFGSVTHVGGTYSASVTGTTTGSVSISATDTSAGVPSAGSASLTVSAGTAAHVTTPTLGSGSIASGQSTTASVDVTDSGGNPVSTDTVSFSQSGSGHVTFGSVSGGGGTYTVTVTGTTAGSLSISATDNTAGISSPSGGPLTVTVGTAANVTTPAMGLGSIASGQSTTASVSVTDGGGNPVAGDSVSFSQSGSGHVTFGSVSGGGGTYTVTVTGTTVGSLSISATDSTAGISSPSGAPLTVTAGAAAHVSLTLSPTSIVAGGATPSTATATVTDASGNPVDGQTVTFASSGGNVISSTIGVGGGTGRYTATISPTTTAGVVTITARDGSLTSNAATLTQTAGTPTTLTVTLAPPTIIANGTSTTKATATVKDANGNPVQGDTVTFSASPAGEKITPSPPGTTAPTGITAADGTYAVTITSSSKAQVVTITATDSTVALHGAATLTQTAGAVVGVNVVLTPNSLMADGTSTATATATVTDANGNPVQGDSVTFSTSDPGEKITPSPTGSTDVNGTFTVTITSSTTVANVTITATDTTTGLSGHANLAQAAGSSSTVLSVGANAPVTNQPVTLSAKVTVSIGSPAGTVAFDNGAGPIAGCASVPVNSAGSATCQGAFAASASPVLLTAVFTPTVALSVAGSKSATQSLAVGPGTTSTVLQLSANALKVGGTVTYTATVTPVPGGSTVPSGAVEFFDGSTPVKACAKQLLTQGPSSSIATCTLSYKKAGKHSITARYLADANFTSSVSPAATVKVTVAAPKPSVLTTMRWTFFYAPKYTVVRSLLINKPPAGGSIVINCTGRSCPFTKRVIKLAKRAPCRPASSKRCTRLASATLDITSELNRHRLNAGTRLVIEVVHPNWIGKYYKFTIVVRKAPTIQIACLAPGATRPGVGC